MMDWFSVVWTFKSSFVMSICGGTTEACCDACDAEHGGEESVLLPGVCRYCCRESTFVLIVRWAGDEEVRTASASVVFGPGFRLCIGVSRWCMCTASQWVEDYMSFSLVTGTRERGVSSADMFDTCRFLSLYWSAGRVSCFSSISSVV